MTKIGFISLCDIELRFCIHRIYRRDAEVYVGIKFIIHCNTENILGNFQTTFIFLVTFKYYLRFSMFSRFSVIVSVLLSLVLFFLVNFIHICMIWNLGRWILFTKHIAHLTWLVKKIFRHCRAKIKLIFRFIWCICTQRQWLNYCFTLLYFASILIIYYTVDY